MAKEYNGGCIYNAMVSCYDPTDCKFKRCGWYPPETERRKRSGLTERYGLRKVIINRSGGKVNVVE